MVGGARLPAGNSGAGAWSRGREAEDAAHRRLLESGYLPVARNVRSRLGEIDLVAREGGELVFVEIRARSAGGRGAPAAFEQAAESVGGTKQARLRRMAAWFMARQGLSPDTACRFDVVLVRLSRRGVPVETHVLRDAFR